MPRGGKLPLDRNILKTVRMGVAERGADVPERLVGVGTTPREGTDGNEVGGSGVEPSKHNTGRKLREEVRGSRTESQGVGEPRGRHRTHSRLTREQTKGPPLEECMSPARRRRRLRDRDSLPRP